jgi:hypothetical protein
VTLWKKSWEEVLNIRLPEEIRQMLNRTPKVFIPQQVVTELDMGRFIRRDTVDPREYDWANLVFVTRSEIDQLPQNRLGMGERAVIRKRCSRFQVISPQPGI